MKHVQNTFKNGWLIPVLFGFLMVGSFAQDGKKEESNARIIVLEKGDEIPRDFTHRQGPKVIVREIEEFMNDVPEDHKAKIYVGSFYNQNSGNYNDRVERMVILNEENEKDGVEWVYSRPSQHIGVKRKVPWKDGVRHGTEKVFDKASEKYDWNKYVKKEIPWKNGEIDGVKKAYHPNKEVMSEVPYRNGDLHGKSKIYDDQGNVTQIVPYKNGKRHGKMIYYWSGTDQKKKVVPTKNGNVDGTAKMYYKDGTLKAEMPFKNDVLHGVLKRYDENGNLDRKRHYIDGEQVPEGVFKDQFDGKK